MKPTNKKTSVKNDTEKKEFSVKI